MPILLGTLYFWKPEYQTHANGARMVAEVIMVAPSPGDLASFFGQLQTPDAVNLDGDTLRMATARGHLSVVTPGAFERRFGAPFYSFHRADLHAVLSRAVLANDAGCIAVDHQAVDIVEGDDGVTVEFENGTAKRTEILIAADGVLNAPEGFYIKFAPYRFLKDLARAARQ